MSDKGPAFLTPEIRARIEALPEGGRAFMEAYAEICGSREDFELTLRAQESKAAGRSKADIVMDELRERGMIQENFDHEASVMIHSESGKERGYPVCTVRAVNRGEACSFLVSIQMGDGAPLRHVIDMAAGESAAYVIGLPGGTRVPNGQREVFVSVIDQAGCVLTSSFGNVTFTGDVKKVQPPKADIRVRDAVLHNGERSVAIATVSLSSESGGNFRIVTDDTVSERIFETFVMQPGGSDEIEVRYDRIAGRSGGYPVKIKVLFDGSVIAKAVSNVTVENPVRELEKEPEPKIEPEPGKEPETEPGKGTGREPAAPSISRRRFRHKVDYTRVVDVNFVDDGGNVNLCTIQVENDGQADDVTVLVTLSGRTVYNDMLRVRGKASCDVDVPAVSLRSDSAHSDELTVAVYDADGLTVMNRSFGITVRSRFDLYNMTAKGIITDRTRKTYVRFVNPLLPEVRAFVDDSNGPLAKEMGKSYFVAAYQTPDHMMAEIEAAFNAVRDQGIKYVSSVSTVPEERFYFQNVKWPDAVLRTKSANCAEYSVLFASIFEAMGYDPILVGVPGHMMVGVAFSSTGGGSTACRPPGKHRTFKLETEYGTVDTFVFEATLAGYAHVTLQQAVDSAAETLTKAAEGGKGTVLELSNELKKPISVAYMRNVKNIKPLV